MEMKEERSLAGVVLEPSPGKCVETVARQRYWRQVDILMKRLAEDADPGDLEQEVDLLQAFLESADIPAIRRRTEEVMEAGDRALVVLRRSGHGGLLVDIEPGRP
jgi:hypothetical protein